MADGTRTKICLIKKVAVIAPSLCQMVTAPQQPREQEGSSPAGWLEKVPHKKKSSCSCILETVVCYSYYLLLKLVKKVEKRTNLLSK